VLEAFPTLLFSTLNYLGDVVPFRPPWVMPCFVFFLPRQPPLPPKLTARSFSVEVLRIPKPPRQLYNMVPVRVDARPTNSFFIRELTDPLWTREDKMAFSPSEDSGFFSSLGVEPSSPCLLGTGLLFPPSAMKGWPVQTNGCRKAPSSTHLYAFVCPIPITSSGVPSTFQTHILRHAYASFPSPSICPASRVPPIPSFTIYYVPILPYLVV